MTIGDLKRFENKRLDGLFAIVNVRLSLMTAGSSQCVLRLTATVSAATIVDVACKQKPPERLGGSYRLCSAI